MRLLQIFTFCYLGATAAFGASIPSTRDLSVLDVYESLDPRTWIHLEKRKGGGGGKGGGSSSGGKSGSSSSSSSGSSSGSGSSSSGSGSSSSGSGSSSSGSSSGSSRSGSTSSTSNTGGRTTSGSGTKATYGGGKYYAGGASVPYASGARSPLGVTPFLFPAAALAFYPGVWAYGAYGYPYYHPYYYHNHNDTSKNSSIPVTCLCEEYAECGCDDNNNQTMVSELMNTTAAGEPKNSSVAKVVTFANGTSGIYINGTLDNGTTASNSSSSSSSSSSTSTSTSTSSAVQTVVEFSGYWIMVATVIAAIMMQ